MIQNSLRKVCTSKIQK